MEKQRRIKQKNSMHEINRLTWEWYLETRSKNIRITGCMLQKKAREFARTLGFTTFKGSNGWLQNFRKRHKIVYRPRTEDKKEVNVCKRWRNYLIKLMENYEKSKNHNAGYMYRNFRREYQRSLTLNRDKFLQDKSEILLHWFI